MRFGSSAPDAQHDMSEGFMKKANRKSIDDMLPEYDFASMAGGIRGKYVNRYRAGTNLALLDPKVAEASPTDAAVNQALRAVLSISQVMRRPNKVLRRTAPGRRRSTSNH